VVQPWQKNWLNKNLANLSKPCLKFGKIKIWLKLDKNLAKLKIG
jgi:hypothetical protein